MKTKVKRAYDQTAKSDGTRILIDRLWPRGVSKADAHIDLWAKDLAPSNELRKWLHVDPEARYAEFRKRYFAELKKNKDAIREVLPHKKTVTLVTAVKDIDHSHVPVLQKFLEQL